MRYSKRKVAIKCIQMCFISLFILLAINNLKLTISNNKNLETINYLEKSNNNLSVALIESNNDVAELSSQLKSSEAIVMYQYDVNKELNETNSVLDDELEQLKDDNKNLSKELDNSVSRLDTYEKYEYVVFDKAGKRTDITYEQLKTGEEMMTEKGYDPDLLFSIAMVESTGRSDAYNRSSGASGYGQFMPRTGEFVYEELLELGTYDHNTTPKNGDINIMMIAEYIDYLYIKYDGNIVRGIREYCGGGTSYTASYIDKIDPYLPNDKSVYDMRLCKN